VEVVSGKGERRRADLPVAGDRREVVDADRLGPCAEGQHPAFTGGKGTCGRAGTSLGSCGQHAVGWNATR
jgi:hypothetical protein